MLLKLHSTKTKKYIFVSLYEFMNTQIILGYFGALFIGLVLGLLGGGGSILTLPILVYALKIEPVLATAYSLFVVGTTSLTGALYNWRKKMVDIKTGLVFAFPAFVVVYLIRKYLIPWLPETFFSIGDFTVTKDIAIMTFFGIVMTVTSVFMIVSKQEKVPPLELSRWHYPLLFLQGVSVGLIAGLVGAGGGFLIIPTLVLFAKLPMKKAVATSLLVISINSLIGFMGDVQNLTIDWNFLMVFTLLSVVGIFIGIGLGNYIEGKKLKKGFGWFVLAMALFIFYQEIYLT